MRFFGAILVLLCGINAFAAEVIPPAPTRYFNDYANAVSTAVAGQLNQTLEDFERQTSEQIVVAVFPKMQSDSSVEDYTVQVARAWRVGQQKLNNGAVLFVFVQDHKIYIQVGYGLEGALPDALCKRVIDEQITPRFRAGDFDGGLVAGVNGLISAARGEYHGTGKTVADTNRRSKQHFSPLIIFVVLAILFGLIGRRRRWGAYSGGWMFGGGGWGGGWGGGGSSGGGGFSGGGGGFSGGGGSFGGGGAGGSW